MHDEMITHLNENLAFLNENITKKLKVKNYKIQVYIIIRFDSKIEYRERLDSKTLEKFEPNTRASNQ